MKIYKTGKNTWQHGKETDFRNGVAYHKLLGPCPDCGEPTFDYGGWWACYGRYCKNNVSNTVCNNGPTPQWWNTDINVYKDGNAWCATRDGFTNLQECPAGFGDTPRQAVAELLKNEAGERSNPA